MLPVTMFTYHPPPFPLNWAIQYAKINQEENRILISASSEQIVMHAVNLEGGGWIGEVCPS